VCVCTFKRPALLADLLCGLLKQATDEKFTYSIVVVDNDRQQSARETVDRFQREHPKVVSYLVETEQNIALARNRSVAHATGELVAFIDDDEVPIDDWLLRMYAALTKYGVDGILGPVKPRFAGTPPLWAVKARIFERPGFATGFVIGWKQTGTGNVLVWRRALDELEGPFREQFGSGGEDLDLFRRAMEAGKVFVWCEEATVYEIVPAERTRISFQLRRALLRGRASLAHPSNRALSVLKSVAACGLYTILLPVCLVLGWHVFVEYLIKDFDHIGKLLALCRIDLVREKYVVK
jgi:glycosyltransferase involved in cell wall biosynthesis